MTKRVDPTGNQSVLIDITRGPHATIAHACLASDKEGTLVGVGDSKRAPGDKSEQVIGDALAASRALHDLADQLHGLANGASERLNPTPPPTPDPLPQVYVIDRAALQPPWTSGLEWIISKTPPSRPPKSFDFFSWIRP